MQRIQFIRDELNFYWDYKVCPQLLELRNLADVAFLTVRVLEKGKSQEVFITPWTTMCTMPVLLRWILFSIPSLVFARKGI